MTSIVPAPSFRRFVLPRRNNPLARPKRVDAGAELENVKKAWGSVSSYWSVGIARRTDETVELERRATEILAAGELPGDLDVDRFGAAERILNSSATLIDAIGMRFGPAAALRVKARACQWNIAGGRDDQGSYWKLGPNKLTFVGIDVGWHALRRLTSAADDAAYDLVRTMADTMRTESELYRLALAFAFPNELAWTREEMGRLLPSPNFKKSAYAYAPLFASADEALCAAYLDHGEPQHALSAMAYACDVVAGLAPDEASRTLLRLADKVFAAPIHRKYDLRRLATAMTSVRGEGMARALALRLNHESFGRYAADYFEQLPEMATIALGDVARGKSLVADAARHILESNGRVRPTDLAEPSELPPLLRDPPWQGMPATQPADVPPLPFAESIVWAEGERERTAALPVAAFNAQIRPITAEELAEFHKLPLHQKYVDVWPRWLNQKWLLLELPDDVSLALWNENTPRLYQRPTVYMLAHFDHAALDGLFARDPFDSETNHLFEAQMHVVSPRVATVAARALARRRPWRTQARRWLLASPEAAAIGLIPITVGGTRLAKDTLRALRWLTTKRGDVVRDVAKRYGGEAERATLAWMDGDPLAQLDVRGVAPRKLDLGRLPALRLRSGRALPDDAAEHALVVLRSLGGEVPYAGIAVLKEALDPSALRELVWALFMDWSLHGRPRGGAWIVWAATALGGEEILHRLGPYAKAWAHSRPHACVVLAEALASLGSESAMLLLVTMSQHTRYNVVRSAIQTMLDELAKERGLDRDALEDRSMPSLGLDARGEAHLDLGSRVLRISFDESLVPFVALDDGRHLAQLPRPSKDDDPKRAALATRRFQRLRRDAAAIAKSALVRLERAMVHDRRWSAEEFTTLFARHPLLGHLARRLIWGVHTSVLVETFRVVEDGSLADVRDTTFELDLTTRVSILHPFWMDPELRHAWAQVFADYEILQPFEQLGRSVHLPTTAQRDASSLASPTNTIAPDSLLKLLDRYGWEHGSSGTISNAWRAMRARDNTGTIRASITWRPGITIASMRKNAAPISLQPMKLSGNVKLGQIHPVDLSELLRATNALYS